MSTFSIEIKKSAFPLFNKANVKIGDHYFTLNSGETKRINIEEEGNYNVEASINWIKSKNTLLLNANKTVFINFILPNWYFFIGAFILIPLAILAILSIVQPVYLTVPLFIFLLPILYYTFINTSGYFKIISKGN